MTTKPLAVPPWLTEYPPCPPVTGPVGEHDEGPSIRIGSLPSYNFQSVSSFAYDEATYITIPAIGVESAIVSFTVPEGFNGVIKSIGNNFVGAGFTDGSGAIVWRVLQNAQAIRGKENIIASLGTPANPSLIGGGGFIRIIEKDLIQLVALNVSILPAGQLIGGRLSGWLYPKDEDPAGIWF